MSIGWYSPGGWFGALIDRGNSIRPTVVASSCGVYYRIVSLHIIIGEYDNRFEEYRDTPII